MINLKHMLLLLGCPCWKITSWRACQMTYIAAHNIATLNLKIGRVLCRDCKNLCCHVINWEVPISKSTHWREREKMDGSVGVGELIFFSFSKLFRWIFDKMVKIICRIGYKLKIASWSAMVFIWVLLISVLRVLFKEFKQCNYSLKN